jgi:succinate dehydrogenase/fumarate reductase flavoprotein subunit
MEMHLAVDNGYDFDMIVIGGGAAGQKAAISATKAGRRALLVEKKSSYAMSSPAPRGAGLGGSESGGVVRRAGAQ